MEGAWDRGAVILEQESKCRGTVSPSSGQPETAPVTVTIYPRVTQVQLIRPWLSETLLDSFDRKQSPTTEEFFGGTDKTLSIIPERLSILVAEEVHVDFGNSTDSRPISQWAKESRCCSVQCDQMSLSLEPSTPFFIKDTSFRLRRYPQFPCCFR